LHNIQVEDNHRPVLTGIRRRWNPRLWFQSSPVRRRLLRGLGATALQPVITAIIQLGTVPLLLHAWGAAKYGDWLILSAIPSYMSLTDLGFGDASGSDMTMRVAAGDRKGAIETFQSSWVLLTVVSLFVGLLATLLVWRVPWHHWVKLSSLSDFQASAVVLLLGGYLLIGQQCGVFESGFRCDGNFATGSLFGTLSRLVETGLATAIGILTGSLLWAAAVYLITRTVSTIAYGLLLRRKSPWLPIGFSDAKWSRIKELAAPALGFVALPLANAISIQGFTLLIASLLGSVAVTQFSTMRTLTRVNFQLMTVIAWAMWPELSRAFGEGKVPLARKLHHRACQAGLAVSIVTGLGLWYCGPALYHLWIRNVVTFDLKCFHVLVFVTFANSLWFTSSVVPMSTNVHHRIASIFVALSLLSLGLGWVLVHQRGLIGAALALLLTDLFMNYLVLRTSLRQLQEKFGDFVRAILSFPLLFRSNELVEQFVSRSFRS
jgi:O-antigen/teichoic acid export membrane protein